MSDLASVLGLDPTLASPRLRRRGVRDRTALVDKADAFVAFAPSADHARACEVLSRATHGEQWRSYGGPSNPLLPALQCGAPHPDGGEGRCGLSITAIRTDEGDAYRYTSTRCAPAERGHRANFRPYIERPVLAMIAEAYSPASMVGAVEAVQARAGAANRDLAALDRILAQREADYRRAGQLETAAYRDERPLDVEHWAGERRTAQEAVNALLQERAAYKRSMADLSPAGGLERHLAIVREVAGSVASLIARSLPHVGMTRALVGVLTRSLTVRQVAPTVAVVEVEFPNGARSECVVLTGKAPCSQPERVVAYHAVTAGGDLEATVARLTRLNDRYGLHHLLTQDRVRALALLHRFFETVLPPMGPLELTSTLAERIGESEETVDTATLAGLLGAVDITDDGVLLVAPSDVQLEGAFAGYAGRQVEAREDGWIAGDALVLRALRRDYGVSAKAVYRAVKPGVRGRYATDLVGRHYVRRSAIPPKLLARGNPAAGRAAFLAAVRDAADAAGYGDTAIADWWLTDELVAMLRTKAHVGSRPGIRNGRLEGRYLAIPYRGPNPLPGNRKPRLLVYFPAEVAQSGDPERMRAWYRTGAPRPRNTVAPSGVDGSHE